MSSKLPVLAIIDDSVPKATPFGFRSYEFNLILKSISEAEIWTIGQDKKSFDKNMENYLKFYPQDENRIHYLDTRVPHPFKFAYSIFLSITYSLLPFYEKNKIPFVFTLYPGGGFGLNNPYSDSRLEKICNSPCFQGVICTQPITYDYLLYKNFCTPEKILFLFGGYVQFKPQDIPQKQFYSKDKNTFDICFVAFKYSLRGVDKGYDLFIETAQKLAPKYSNLRFHVIGDFTEKDIPAPDLAGKITYYGRLMPNQLKAIYPKMDICLSPNRPFQLFLGNFDGFPLGVEAMCFETVLMTTDVLCNNQNFYQDGEELVVIQPDISDILSKIEPLIQNPERLYQIGKAGQEKTFQLMDPEKRADEVIRFLKDKKEKN